MSTPAPAPATSINLSEVATRYLDGLQKIYDMTVFTLASTRKVNEEDYDQYSQQIHVMPRHEARMGFDQAKEATQQWFLRNSLADSVALIGPLLEDARTICELCLFKVGTNKDLVAFQRIVNEDRAASVQSSLPDRFKVLKEKYNIDCPVQPHMESLVEAAKALIFKQGVLSADEAIHDGKLNVKIRSVQIVQAGEGTANAPAGGGPEPTLTLARRIGDSERVFNVGDKIIFNKAEQVGAILTTGMFITSILVGIQAFAQKTGAADDAQPQ